MAYAMDYYPNELIHMARMGLKEKVIQSKAIWVCVSCWTCATRCPNEIDIVRFMDVLRKESLNGGIKSPVNEIPQFHRVFMKEIQKRGRIDELRLLIRYKLKADGFFSLKRIPKDVMLGLKMFLKGKFKFCSQKMAGQKEVDKIFKKVLHEQ
jgi:heterodisulfide reductase subunit C